MVSVQRAKFPDYPRLSSMSVDTMLAKMPWMGSKASNLLIATMTIRIRWKDILSCMIPMLSVLKKWRML